MKEEDTLDFTQQDGIFNPARARPVKLIGVGSVGSIVAREIASMGVADIEMWDDDEVTSHNVPMSAFGHADIARYKVDVMAERLARDSLVTPVVHRTRWKGEPLSGTVIACVDDMDERKALWDAVEGNPGCDLFIDTRVDVSLVVVYALNPMNDKDCEFYQYFLYPSNKAERQLCGLHGVIQVNLAAASHVCEQLTMWWQHGTKVLRWQKLLHEPPDT